MLWCRDVFFFVVSKITPSFKSLKFQFNTIALKYERMFMCAEHIVHICMHVKTLCRIIFGKLIIGICVNSKIVKYKLKIPTKPSISNIWLVFYNYFKQIFWYIYLLLDKYIEISLQLLYRLYQQIMSSNKTLRINI